MRLREQLEKNEELRSRVFTLFCGCLGDSSARNEVFAPENRSRAARQARERAVSIDFWRVQATQQAEQELRSLRDQLQELLRGLDAPFQCRFRPFSAVFGPSSTQRARFLPFRSLSQVSRRPGEGAYAPGAAADERQRGEADAGAAHHGALPGPGGRCGGLRSSSAAVSRAMAAMARFVIVLGLAAAAPRVPKRFSAEIEIVSEVTAYYTSSYVYTYRIERLMPTNCNWNILEYGICIIILKVHMNTISMVHRSLAFS